MDRGSEGKLQSAAGGQVKICDRERVFPFPIFASSFLRLPLPPFVVMVHIWHARHVTIDNRETEGGCIYNWLSESLLKHGRNKRPFRQMKRFHEGFLKKSKVCSTIYCLFCQRMKSLASVNGDGKRDERCSLFYDGNVTVALDAYGNHGPRASGRQRRAINNTRATWDVARLSW